jgi:hypothetical protein
MYQQGGKGEKEKGEEGGDEAKGNDEKTHPWDDKEVGKKSNEGEPVEMKGNKRCSPQNGHSRDEKGEHDIFEDILLP